jgi:hypothetical protein
MRFWEVRAVISFSLHGFVQIRVEASNAEGWNREDMYSTSTYVGRQRHRECTNNVAQLTGGLNYWLTVRFRMFSKIYCYTPCHVFCSFYQSWRCMTDSQRSDTRFHPEHFIHLTIRYILILSLHLCLGLQGSLFHCDLPIKILYKFTISLARATYCRLITHNITTLTILDEEQRSWMSSLSVISALLLLHSWDINVP